LTSVKCGWFAEQAAEEVDELLDGRKGNAEIASQPPKTLISANILR
jgi:hypothetical protein